MKELFLFVMSTGITFLLLTAQLGVTIVLAQPITAATPFEQLAQGQGQEKQQQQQQGPEIEEEEIEDSDDNNDDNDNGDNGCQFNPPSR